MTKYCIAWKLQKAGGPEVHTGPPLVHQKQRHGCIVSILTKEEAEAKAQRMNLAMVFPSHHWAIQYKGEEWKRINEKSTQTATSGK